MPGALLKRRLSILLAALGRRSSHSYWLRESQKPVPSFLLLNIHQVKFQAVARKGRCHEESSAEVSIYMQYVLICP